MARSTCPDVCNLQWLLDQRESPEESAGIVQHVESCVACQRTLELLTRRQAHLQRLPFAGRYRFFVRPRLLQVRESSRLRCPDWEFRAIHGTHQGCIPGAVTFQYDSNEAHRNPTDIRPTLAWNAGPEIHSYLLHAFIRASSSLT